MKIHFHEGDLPGGVDFGKSVAIDTETLGLSITGEKYTVVSRQHMVTCSCSPSLPLCSVVRCFKDDVLFF